MGACGRGPRTGLRRTASKRLWKTRSVFQAGVGAHPPRKTSKRVHARGRRGSFHRPLRSSPSASLGEGAWGRGDEENGSPGCPRTSAFDLAHWPIPGVPPLGGLGSPLALSGVVADVGQGVDSPQLSIEPARKDEGIEAISEGSQAGKPQAESTRRVEQPVQGCLRGIVKPAQPRSHPLARYVGLTRAWRAP